MKQISLVKIRDYYFPSSEKDYQCLLDSGVTVFRLDSTLIRLLKKTCLRQYEVITSHWPTILTKVQNAFLKEITHVGFKSKLEDENSIVVKFGKLKEPEFDNLLKKYRSNLSRYGIKVVLDFREVPEAKKTSTSAASPASMMVRMKLSENKEIDPALGYNVKTLVDAHQERFINFSSVARLKLVSSLNESKKPFVSLVFEDKIGEQWVESFRRAFDASKTSREEANEFASNLIQSLMVAKLSDASTTNKK